MHTPHSIVPAGTVRTPDLLMEEPEIYCSVNLLVSGGMTTGGFGSSQIM